MRTDTDTQRPMEVRGQDGRLIPAPGHAGQIVNFRWNPEGWWVNDRGWEPLVLRPVGWEYPGDHLAPVRGLWIWSRHQGAEVYYLYERNGVLQYDFGNNADAAAPVGNVILDEDRAIPPPNDPGTQFVPFGRFALLLNGIDGPLKFFGGEETTPFGWTAQPAAPSIARVDPLGLVSSAILSGTSGKSQTGGTFIALLPGSLLAGADEPAGPPFLGTTDGARCAYGYRVSFVSETGSESPMSPEVLVEWEPDEASVLQLLTFAVWLSSVPLGGDHVVARRIYRTKNLGNQSGLVDRTYYFVDQIDDNCSTSYVDVRADARLTVFAPALEDSAPIPPGLRYGCSFDGRLWLGGGSHAPTRVLYSQRNAPEQFGAFSYFDLGNVGAGDITQIVAHEGQVYVFRERGIDAIRVTDTLEYQLVTISGTVGTTASNAITAVPGFGLVFLSRDGVFSLTRQGLRKISDGISREIARLGAGSLARATAAWSPRENEWWVQYPADGAAENVRGAVLHTLISTPEAPAWTLRHVPPSDGSSVWRTVVTALATDPDGWIVFGAAPINTTDGSYPGLATLAAAGVGDTIEGLGLQVWTARPAGGTVYTVTSKPEGIVTSRADAPAIEAVFQSPWLGFPQKGRVMAVECWVVNSGRPDFTFETAYDGREEWTALTASDIEFAPFGTLGKSTGDHLYATDATAAARGYQGVWGSSRWREDRLVRIVWHVHLAPSAIETFAWRIRGRDAMGIRAWRAGANLAQIPTLEQHTAGGA